MMIERREKYFDYMKKRLRLAAIDFNVRSSYIGFELPGFINKRTGSVWYSPEDAHDLLKEKAGRW